MNFDPPYANNTINDKFRYEAAGLESSNTKEGLSDKATELSKIFVPPMHFKFGQNFPTKSEQRRTEQMNHLIQKLHSK